MNLAMLTPAELRAEYTRVTKAMALSFPREDATLRHELNAIVAEARRRDDRALTTAQMGQVLLHRAERKGLCG